MNGSTWGRYRFALRQGTAGSRPEPAPFLGEPWNPPDYPLHFAAAGFTVAARYESRIASVMPEARPGALALAARVAASGITVRHLRVADLEAELRRLYRFSALAFADSPFYRTVDFPAFHERYRSSLAWSGPTRC